MHIIKPVTMCINFRVYIEGKLKYFIPISTTNKKKEMIKIAIIAKYQSEVGTDFKIFKIGLTKQQY
jgi:hypothetical protein